MNHVVMSSRAYERKKYKINQSFNIRKDLSHLYEHIKKISL